jgi:hypothetical protein
MTTTLFWGCRRVREEIINASLHRLLHLQAQQLPADLAAGPVSLKELTPESALRA